MKNYIISGSDLFILDQLSRFSGCNVFKRDSNTSVLSLIQDLNTKPMFSQESIFIVKKAYKFLSQLPTKEKELFAKALDQQSNFSSLVLVDNEFRETKFFKKIKKYFTIKKNKAKSFGTFDLVRYVKSSQLRKAFLLINNFFKEGLVRGSEIVIDKHAIALMILGAFVYDLKKSPPKKIEILCQRHQKLRELDLALKSDFDPVISLTVFVNGY